MSNPKLNKKPNHKELPMKAIILSLSLIVLSLNAQASSWKSENLAQCGAYTLSKETISGLDNERRIATVVSYVVRTADGQPHGLKLESFEDLDVYRGAINTDLFIVITSSFQPFAGIVYTYELISLGGTTPAQRCVRLK
jgi:hypothetical protein